MSYIISELSKAVSKNDERSFIVEKLKDFLDLRDGLSRDEGIACAENYQAPKSVVFNNALSLPVNVWRIFGLVGPSSCGLLFITKSEYVGTFVHQRS